MATMPIITSQEALTEVVEAALQNCLSRLMPALHQTAGTSAELLTEREACTMLGGISKPTLYKLVAEGHITRHKLGAKRTLYSRAEMQAYVLSNKKTA